MIVVDASVIVETLLRFPAADAVDRRILDTPDTLHAPHLIDVEVTQAVRRHLATGAIDLARADAAMRDLAHFPMRRYPHTGLIGRAWSLRNNLTAYDAAYVALAEALDAPLVTRDRRIAGAAGHGARVELV